MAKQRQWRYTGQSVVGTGHAKTGLPCQDAHGVEIIDEMLVAIVADGAGSAKHSDRASALIVEETLEAVRNWDSFPEDRNVWQDRMLELTQELRTQLQQQAEQAACSLKEFSTTMLLCIVSSDRIAGMQIGDGAIVLDEAEGESLSLFTAPVQGEYLNLTVFLTSQEYQKHLQISYQQRPVSKVALFSDGLQMLALDITTQPPSPHLPFFQPFFEFLQTVHDAEQRKMQLRKFLESPRICSRTDDDKTLVVALRL